MNPKSASALVWASIITIVLGMMVGSPGAGFVLYIVAVVLSTAPLLCGAKLTRVAAALTFAISLALALQGYPAFDKERDAYRKHSEVRSVKAPAPPAAQQQQN